MKKYEVFSTGGGCYTSAYHTKNYIYTIENEFPNIMVCYKKDSSDNYAFYEENMIYCYDGLSDEIEVYTNDFISETKLTNKALHKRLLNNFRKENIKAY